MNTPNDMSGAIRIELQHLREQADAIKAALTDAALTPIGAARLLVRLSGLNADLAGLLDNVTDTSDVEF